MKTLTQASLFLSLTFASLLANAGILPDAPVPEIGMGSAALGFGLLAGFVALIVEKRRK